MNTSFRNQLMLLASLLLIAPSTFAQHGTGNGGGAEIAFHNLSTSIDEWLNDAQALNLLDSLLHLQGTSVTAPALIKAYEAAVSSTPDVKFIPEAKLEAECNSGDAGACMLAQNVSRICMNQKNPNFIRCNQDAFFRASGRIQFSIVFHEYLGVAGIEANGASELSSYSRYPISQYLYKNTRAKKVKQYELVIDSGGSTGEREIETERRYPVTFNRADLRSPIMETENFLLYKTEHFLGRGCGIVTLAKKDLLPLDEVDFASKECNVSVKKLSAHVNRLLIEGRSDNLKSVSETFLSVDPSGKLSLISAFDMEYEFVPYFENQGNVLMVKKMDSPNGGTQSYVIRNYDIPSGALNNEHSSLPNESLWSTGNRYSGVVSAINNNPLSLETLKPNLESDYHGLQQFHIYDWNHQELGVSEIITGVVDSAVVKSRLYITATVGNDQHEKTTLYILDEHLKTINKRVVSVNSTLYSFGTDHLALIDPVSEQTALLDENGAASVSFPGAPDVMRDPFRRKNAFNFLYIVNEKSGTESYFDLQGNRILAGLESIDAFSLGNFLAIGCRESKIGAPETDCTLVNQEGHISFAAKNEVMFDPDQSAYRANPVFLFTPKPANHHVNYDIDQLHAVSSLGQSLWRYQAVQISSEAKLLFANENELAFIEKESTPHRQTLTRPSPTIFTHIIFAEDAK